MAEMEAQKFFSATTYTPFGNALFNFSNFTHFCPAVVFVAFVPQNQAMWMLCTLTNLWITDVWIKAMYDFVSFFL